MEKRKSKNIRIVIRIICFLLIFLILLCLVSRLLTPKTYDNNEYMNFRGFYAEKQNSLDIIYMGTSMDIVSWMPYEMWHETEITSYALGHSTLGSFAYVPLIKEALAYQQPQLLILDARPFLYTFDYDDGSEFNLTLNFLDSFKFTSLNRIPIALGCYEAYRGEISAGVREPGEGIFPYILFNIARYHSNWTEEIDKSDYGDIIPNESDTKGYYEMRVHTGNYPLYNRADYSSMTPIKEQAEEDLFELLDYLDKIGIETLFVVAPYSESETDKAEYNYISQIVKDRGHGFADFNDYIEEIGLDKGVNLYNANHLNVFGGEKYTAYLTKYIADNYDITPNGDAAVQASWAEGYPTWLARKTALEQDVQKAIDDYNEEQSGQ